MNDWLTVLSACQPPRERNSAEGAAHRTLALARQRSSSRPIPGESQSEPARLAVHRLFQGSHPPPALVSGNNLMTLGVLQALRELGLTAPHDLALACFDDFDWADLVTPGS